MRPGFMRFCSGKFWQLDCCSSTLNKHRFGSQELVRHRGRMTAVLQYSPVPRRSAHALVPACFHSPAHSCSPQTLPNCAVESIDADLFASSISGGGFQPSDENRHKWVA